MCGIVGFTGMRDEALLHAMNERQLHRGPDDGGTYFDSSDGVSLAMRRLSILDLAGGHQPMASADGEICIVYNGEIMNAPALRAQLEAGGSRFVTNHCDTEVLLHLYARDGERMLEHLNGMFAFVIHDRRRRRLFGARDHFGIKPLYYALVGERFAFASELKSLELMPNVDLALSPAALSLYLSFQCVPSPLTIHAGVRKLPAAHSFTFDLERRELSIARYWRPSPGSNGSAGMSRPELVALVREELEAGVDRWMLSDVPVACSLSGGIDSSALIGLMAARTSARIPTYSLGFADAPHLDERSLAQQVARRWNTEHHEIVLGSDDLLNDLDPMIESLDEPYAGGLPSWFVFKRMAGEVKVCITGTGGDELFGNYGKWRPFESPWRRLRVAAGLARTRPGWLSDWARFPRGSLYPMYFRECDKRAGLLNENWLCAGHSAEEWVESAWQAGAPTTGRDGVRIVDLQIQLPDEFLHMTDRFSMAHSVEARPPFLDRVLAEKLMSVPAAARIGSGHLKSVLIEAVHDLLPSQLLAAPKKGFVLPMRGWLAGKLRKQVEHFLGVDYLRRQGIFDERINARLVRPHLAGRADKSWQIWTLLMFQLWHARRPAR
jgi:asparagine synthase (glutamine-hydrolysing)